MLWRTLNWPSNSRWIPARRAVEIELALAKAYESVGNLVEALGQYRSLLAQRGIRAFPRQGQVG